MGQPNDQDWNGDCFQGRLVTCRVEELRPHVSYERHRFTVSPSRLSALAARGDVVWHEPLMITKGRAIIDGYGRWELARRQGRTTVTCIEYDLSEEEALHWLLQRHQRVECLNAFCRILLALDLEPWLQEKARTHQRAGGVAKGSSKLTEADRLDVRSEIAAAAGVSVGNVTKVKQLITRASAELYDALRNGELSIHRAWLWREMSPQAQRQTLMQHRGEKGMRKTIRGLVSKHVPKGAVGPTVTIGLGDLTRCFSQLQSSQFSSVAVVPVNVPGKAVFVTEELLQILEVQGELPIRCVAESH